MPNCPDCGAAVDAGRKTCPNCDARIAPLPEAVLGRINNLTNRIEQDAQNPQLFLELGDLYVENECYKEGLAEYQKIIDFDEANFDALAKSADLFIKLKVFDRAESFYRKALHINPRSRECYHGLFISYYRQNKFDEALILGAKLERAEPKNAEVRRILHAIYLQNENREKAEDELAALEKLQPDDLYVLKERMQQHQENGEDEKAIEYGKKLLAIDPAQTRVRQEIWKYYYQKGDFENAVRFDPDTAGSRDAVIPAAPVTPPVKDAVAPAAPVAPPVEDKVAPAAPVAPPVEDKPVITPGPAVVPNPKPVTPASPPEELPPGEKTAPEPKRAPVPTPTPIPKSVPQPEPAPEPKPAIQPERQPDPPVINEEAAKSSGPVRPEEQPAVEAKPAARPERPARRPPLKIPYKPIAVIILAGIVVYGLIFGFTKLSSNRIILKGTSAPGLSIILDGKPVPVEVDKSGRIVLPRRAMGKHHLVVEKEGYEKYERNVNVPFARNAVLEVNLIPCYGALKIASQPAGAAVFIDGEKKGATPCFIADLLAVKHKIEIKAEGYGDWSANLKIARNDTVDLGVVRLQNFTGTWRAVIGEGSSWFRSEFTMRIKQTGSDIEIKFGFQPSPEQSYAGTIRGKRSQSEFIAEGKVNYRYLNVFYWKTTKKTISIKGRLSETWDRMDGFVRITDFGDHNWSAQRR